MIKDKIHSFYSKNYKILMLIPIIITILSLVYTGIFYNSTGDFFKKDVTLKGGISSIKGLIEAIKKYNIKRVALDSLVFFEYLYPRFDGNKMEFRRQVLIFMEQMKKAGVTFMVVSERSVTDFDRLTYEMMDFVFEGIILLSRIRKGSYFERVLTVAKVRGQDHSLDVYPVTIGHDGLKVLYDQTPFSLVEKEDSGFK